MDFDFTRLPEKDRYRLLTNFVGPRPIALVTTIGEDGGANAAPMSFFNVFSHEPPILILGIQTRPDGHVKDTVANIRRSGEFVAHMVDLSIAKQMILTGIDLPSDVDEVAFAGLTSTPSIQVAPPRIAELPCAMECKVLKLLDFGRRSIVLGEVVQMHVRDDCLDERGHYVRPDFVSADRPVACRQLHRGRQSVRARKARRSALEFPRCTPAPVNALIMRTGRSA